ncbi:F390 synthetase-related protein [Tessaracoccus sp. OH4464_COT-324]|uniref:F390 synthetase-related protein n=1 Tax=Tessaracoccus sp. OH4464_COT-324 TaxID=2491059 RepID=UPI000F6348F3|nr:F390 synthetase-related protein [Tessaracoccus sp. OH4464_COT-324]RRD46346.1 hypothetical protein EII42_07505 [Tessaracoccus sp. OH4464_COT-324]
MTSRPADLAVIAAEGIAAARRRLRTRAAVERRQDRLARTQIPWLIAHSAWTARRFSDAGLPPGRWRELPPVEKPDMMGNFDQLNTVGARLDDVLALAREAEATRDFTGQLTTRGGEITVGLSTGTSGTQGAFIVSRADRLRWAGSVLAAIFRPFPWALQTPQRVAFFLRADGGLYRTAASRRVSIDFYDILRPVEELADRLTRTSPTVIVGPPSVLRAVADAGGRARPSRVVSVAEVLEGQTEAFLAGWFGAPVIQIYQATEGLLGLPCAAGQLHLAEEHVHIEAEPVGEGLVRPVITDLRRRAQPVVRHRLNDLLKLGDGCGCGSATRRIVRIVGRQDDALLLPGANGEVTIWPDFLRAALSRVPELREYRLIQTGPAALCVEVEPWLAGLRATVRDHVLAELDRHGVRGVSLTDRPWQPLPPGVKLRRVFRNTNKE